LWYTLENKSKKWSRSLISHCWCIPEMYHNVDACD
jgi:hypothetical protein